MKEQNTQLTEVVSSLVKNGDGSFTEKDIENYLESLSNKKVSDMEINSNQRLVAVRGTKVTNNPASLSKEIEITEQEIIPQIEVTDKTKKVIVEKIVQNGTTAKRIGITKQSMNDYKGIPPIGAMTKIKEAWKSGEFTQISSLEPVEGEVVSIASVRPRPMPAVKDPVFVGEKCGDNRMYFICGWLEDVTLGRSLLENYMIGNV